MKRLLLFFQWKLQLLSKELTTLIPPPHCHCYLKTTGYVIKRASHKFFLDNVFIFALKIDGQYENFKWLLLYLAGCQEAHRQINLLLTFNNCSDFMHTFWENCVTWLHIIFFHLFIFVFFFFLNCIIHSCLKVFMQGILKTERFSILGKN